MQPLYLFKVCFTIPVLWEGYPQKAKHGTGPGTRVPGNCGHPDVSAASLLSR